MYNLIKFGRKVQFIKIMDSEKHKYERVAYFFIAPLILLFALEIMQKYQQEVKSIKNATYKVRGV